VLFKASVLQSICILQDSYASTSNFSSLVQAENVAVVQWEGTNYNLYKQYTRSGGIELFVVNPTTELIDLVVNFEDILLLPTSCTPYKSVDKKFFSFN